MRVEIDEDPLVRTRRGDHPGAPLGGGVTTGVTGRGEVAGGGDFDVASAFICGVKKAELRALLVFTNKHPLFWCAKSFFCSKMYIFTPRLSSGVNRSRHAHSSADCSDGFKLINKQCGIIYQFLDMQVRKK